MATLGTVLAAARKLRGMTQADVGKALDVTRQAVGQWEADKTEPETDNLVKVAELLRIDLLAARQGQIVSTEQIDTQFSVRRRSGAPTQEFRHTPLHEDGLDIGERDVPVYGVAMGGVGADFYNNGEVIDYVRRPLGIIRAKSVYGIYVVGNSMEPRFDEGDLVCVSSDRPPRPGDYVILELHPDTGERVGAGFIKKLHSNAGGQVIVEQFNPPQRLKFPRESVRILHRIIPWHDLLGT